jgi:hypothetical protein
MVLCASSLLTIVGSVGYLTFAAQVNQMATSTVTLGSSLSTSLSQPQQLIYRSFTVLSTTGTTLRCEFWNFTFTGNQEQYVSGNFTSDNQIDFYVVQDTSYQNWLKTGSCGNVGDAIASQLLSKSFSFNAALPSTGTWLIVLVNSSNSKNADGFIAAYLSAGSYTITQQLLSTITTTTTSANTVTPSTNIPGFPIESIAVGVLVGLVALMILRHRSRLQR